MISAVPVTPVTPTLTMATAAATARATDRGSSIAPLSTIRK